MTTSSNWPLPTDGVRFFITPAIVHTLATQATSQHLFPHGFGYYPDAFGHHMQRDNHEDHLLMYCRSGYGSIVIEQQHYNVTPGDLIVLPKNTKHHYTAHDEQPWTLYWVHFDGNKAEYYLDAIQAKEHDILHIGHPPKLIADWHLLLESRHRPFDVNQQIYAANVLAQILSFIALNIQSRDSYRQHGIDSRFFEQYLSEHLHTQISVEEMAKVAGLSKFHFIKSYKQATGFTPIQHFISLKIHEACQLLDTTTEPINQIAKSLGYDDPYYFSRQFKKIMGISPSEYQSKR